MHYKGDTVRCGPSLRRRVTSNKQQLTKPTIPTSAITGLVLAGGRGSRMGGVDKGLQVFAGQPLALHTLRRLQAGAGLGAYMLNANRNLDVYRQFGVPVHPDAVGDFAGPLAGFLAGLDHCPSDYLLAVPCDTPLFPVDLVPRLAQALDESGALLAMPSAPEADGQGLSRVRLQPVFCLMHVSVATGLRQYMLGGGRKIDTWFTACAGVVVPFDRPGDDPQAFFNLNTLDELAQAQQP